jgi:CelD/BcsL family acetyltransferase involved in cellulose biosynthesis
LHFARLESAAVEALARIAAEGAGRGWPALDEELCEARRAGDDLCLGLRDGARWVGWWAAHRVGSGAAGGAPGVRVLGAGIAPGYREQWGELVARGADRAQRAAPEAALELAGGESAAPALLDALAALGWRAPASRPAGGSLRLERARPGSAAWSELPLVAEWVIEGARCAVRAARCESHWDWLAPHWARLLAATPGTSAFQSFDFLRCWWRCFGEPRRLWILAIERQGELIGIAPLQLAVRRRRGADRCVLGFLGALPEVHEPAALFGAHAAPCNEVLLRCLAGELEPWDELDLHEQPAAAPLTEQLRRELRRRRRFARVESDPPSPYLRLAGRSFEEFFAACSRTQRQNVRSAQRKLEARGALTYTRVRGVTALREALAQYRALEARSWKLGQSCSVSAPGRAPLFDALVEVLGAREEFEIAFLRLDGEPIAGTIALPYPPRFMHLEITYDPQLGKYSPGMVLEYFELQELFAAGRFSEYCFLGGNLQHKLRWVPELREQVRVYARRPSPLAALEYAWLLGLRPWLRRAQGQLRGLQTAPALRRALQALRRPGPQGNASAE